MFLYYQYSTEKKKLKKMCVRKENPMQTSEVSLEDAEKTSFVTQTGI